MVRPLLVLWDERGMIGRCLRQPALWRERAEAVQGWALPGGHHLAEEHPDEASDAPAALL